MFSPLVNDLKYSKHDGLFCEKGWTFRLDGRTQWSQDGHHEHSRAEPESTKNPRATYKDVLDAPAQPAHRGAEIVEGSPSRAGWGVPCRTTCPVGPHRAVGLR